MLYSSPGRLDSPQALIGDKRWLGVNMRLDPALLPPGYCSEAVNMRFRHGVPETRKGTMMLPWMNKITDGILDQDGNIIARAGAWGEVYGQGTFSDPNTRFDYTIIAADGYVYQTTENNAPSQLALPSGVTITGPVTFTQAYDQLIMWRGPNDVPLIMRSIFTGFDYITQSSAPADPDYAYLLPIPNASRAIFFQNRLIVPYNDDELAVSDIGDITRYSPSEADFKINKGTTDKIVSLVKFNENTLIIFKERSIYAVYNVYGSLAAIQLDTITSQYGCVSAESIVQTGADIWFLSQIGVMSLKQTELNKVQATALPVSEPVQSIVERINWRYAANATAALWDSKYYLAIPVDNATAFRDTLVSAGTPYSTGGELDVAVTSGRCYTFKAGYENGTLTNSDESVEGDRMFTARSSTVTLNGTSGFSGELLPTFVGVNSIVLVYDFLNQAWSGYDQAAGIEPQKFFIAKKGNKDRLFFINKDGWVLLYEENYTDHRTEPYVELQLVDADVGDTVKINGGDTITVTESGSSNTSTQWYTVSPSYNQKIYYLFGDRAAATNGWGFSGAYGSAPVAWSAPDCRFVLARADGVSLIDQPALKFDTLRAIATNGIPPTIVTTGAWATLVQVSKRQIDSYMVTRGFGIDPGDNLTFSNIDIDIQTWNPCVTIETETPGFIEGVSGRAAITRSRTTYDQPARATDYNESNTNDDFRTPYRQDYSVVIPADGIYLSNDGVALGVHQEARINVNASPSSGRYTKVKIRNTCGRIRVMSVRVASTVKPSVSGIHI